MNLIANPQNRDRIGKHQKRSNERVTWHPLPMSTNKYGFFGTPGEPTLPHEVLNDANKQGGVLGCAIEMKLHMQIRAKLLQRTLEGGGNRGLL